jgi:hypothetical protein
MSKKRTGPTKAETEKARRVNAALLALRTLSYSWALSVGAEMAHQRHETLTTLYNARKAYDAALDDALAADIEAAERYHLDCESIGAQLDGIRDAALRKGWTK